MTIPELIQEGKRRTEETDKFYKSGTSTQFLGAAVACGNFFRNNLPTLLDELERVQGERDALLEKQNPKSPIFGSWIPAKCPSCGEELSESVGDGYYRHETSREFCSCGQRLDWRANENG